MYKIRPDNQYEQEPGCARYSADNDELRVHQEYLLFREESENHSDEHAGIHYPTCDNDQGEEDAAVDNSECEYGRVEDYELACLAGSVGYLLPTIGIGIL